MYAAQPSPFGKLELTLCCRPALPKTPPPVTVWPNAGQRTWPKLCVPGGLLKVRTATDLSAVVAVGAVGAVGGVGGVGGGFAASAGAAVTAISPTTPARP